MENPDPQPPRNKSIWEWLRRHTPRWRGYARKRTPNKADADDVVSSLFSRLWLKGTNAVRGLSRRTNYVFGMIRNIAKSHWRRKRGLPIEPRSMSSIEARTSEGSDEVCLEDYLRRRSLRELPSDERTLLEWQQQDSLSYEEMAQRLSISVDAVGQRLTKARRRLLDGFELLRAGYAAGWQEGTLFDQLLCLRHFQGFSEQSIKEQKGCTRQRLKDWLATMREALPEPVRGLI